MTARPETSVNIHEAKTHLSKLLERVRAGERIVIARAGKPIAVLEPYRSSTSRSDAIGMDEGKIVIHDNFDDPLPDLEEYF